MTYTLFNKTDGIRADPRSFKTEAAALRAAAEFRDRINRIQGYYAAADGRRLKPNEIELEVITHEK